MSTCDTCKHWSVSIDTGRNNLRRCMNTKLSDDVFEDDCLNAGGLYEDGAVVDTGPKFGCIHHEPKP